MTGADMSMSTSTFDRVAICGVGAISGYGWGAKLLWEGLTSGVSAVTATPGYGSHFAADEAFVARIPEGGDPADGASRFGRAVVGAAREAINDALDRGWRPGPVVGLVHAFVLGEVDLWKDFYATHDGRRRRKEYMELMPSTPVSLVMQEHQFNGPCMGVSAMCASGNTAALTAKMWIDAGIATDVVVVTTDISLNPENVWNFCQLGVAHADRGGFEVCRPFSAASSGFNMGEASVAMVMSNQRDAGYAVIKGGAMTNDAHHVVSIAPDHEQIKRCVNNALADSGVAAEEVIYLNAHATGTIQCDAAEADVLESVLVGADVYATKAFTGHCQGAAAGIELVIAALTYEKDIVPAARAENDAFPRLLDGPSRRRPGPTVKTALGMGGHNAAVVLDEA